MPREYSSQKQCQKDVFGAKVRRTTTMADTYGHRRRLAALPAGLCSTLTVC